MRQAYSWSCVVGCGKLSFSFSNIDLQLALNKHFKEGNPKSQREMKQARSGEKGIHHFFSLCLSVVLPELLRVVLQRQMTGREKGEKSIGAFL